VITHNQAYELLAPFALDAVSTTERVQIEAHLVECPRCRAEVDAYRDVAAAMGNSVEPLPEGLWSSIASRLPERPQTETPPMPHLEPVEGALDTPAELSIARRRRQRLSGGRLATLGSFAVAAAAAAVVLGIGLFHADQQVNNLRTADAHRHQPTVAQLAMATPGHKVVSLDTPAGARLARFVVVPGGRGYLLQSSFPALPSKEVYQLWAIVAERPISLGLLGSSPTNSAFTIAEKKSPYVLAVTVEPALGSTSPTSPILATGTV
jgi:anti-sigma-K factor RskA